MKGWPLTCNEDRPEDKEPLPEAVAVGARAEALRMMTEMVCGMAFKRKAKGRNAQGQMRAQSARHRPPVCPASHGA